jgi:hypothetical protein
MVREAGILFWESAVLEHLSSRRGPKLSLAAGDQYEINLGTDAFQFRKPDYAPSKFSWLKNATELLALDNNGLLKVTNGVDVGGSPNGYNGEVRFTTDLGNGTIYGVSTAGTGNITIYFDHRGTGNLGNWVWRNGSAAGIQRMTLNNIGELQVVGSNHYFGPGAYGGTSKRFHISHDASFSYLAGEDGNGVTGNGNLFLQGGSVYQQLYNVSGDYRWHKVGGGLVGQLDQAGFFTLNSGLAYSKLQLQTNQARMMIRGDQNGLIGFDEAGNQRYLMGTRSDVTGNTVDTVYYGYGSGGKFRFYLEGTEYLAIDTNNWNPDAQSPLNIGFGYVGMRRLVLGGVDSGGTGFRNVIARN